MGIEHLDVAQHRMHYQHATNALTREPVATLCIKRRAIEGKWLHGRSNNRESREYYKPPTD